MKIKKRYLIILLIILTIAIIGFVFNQKDIQISNIKNKEYKESYTFEKTSSCDKYYDGTIDSNDIIWKDDSKNIKIIKTENTNISALDGGTSWPYAYMINNCLDTAENFYKKTTEATTACNALKDYVKSGTKYQQTFYNADYCVNNNIVEEIEIPEENHTCSYDFETNATEGWTSPRWAYDGYVDTNYSSENWAEFWLTTSAENCGCNHNLKYFVKNLAIKNVLKATCGDDYVLNESGYHTHTAIDSNGNPTENCYKNGVFYQTGTCPLECSNESRTAIINENDGAKAKNFNQACPDYEKIPLSEVTIDWQGGWGPSYLEGNWDGGNGIYSALGVEGRTHTVTFDSALKYYNHNLIGWSTDSTCPSSNITYSSGLNHTFNIGTNDITYYACYSGDIYENTLFNSGTKNSGTEVDKYEITECNDAETTNNNITSVPMSLMSRYTTRSYETITTSSDYCNVLCTDTVDVNYPNIFETVPAGQYFELMYEPEISASRVCQSEFNFTKWDRDYRNAIAAEKAALSELERAKAYYKAADALSPRASSSCGCCGEECDPCKIYYYDQKTEYYYSAEGNYLSQPAEFGACGSSDTSSIVNAARNALANARNDYARKVNARIMLEQNNLSCYTVLDAIESNNVNLPYTDIFPNNYQTIEEINPTYRIDTAKVTIPNTAYGTKGTYQNYIVQNTSASSSPITSTNLTTLGISNGITTKAFYALYPQLDFTYEVGIPDEYSGSAEKTITDTLIPESHIKQDTGSYTSVTNGVYQKDSTPQPYNYEFNVEGNDNQYIQFNSYFSSTKKSTYRTVKYYFIFREGTEFYSSLQSGEYSKTNEPNKNVSLSKLSKYTKKAGSQLTTTIKNNVYPTSLMAVNGNYDVSFNLSDQKEQYLYSTFGITNTNQNYTCSYEITNDALTLSHEKETYKDLKSNTIFRSVATNNLDPNKRSDTGKLGENWTNKKGQAVKNKIETTEGQEGDTTIKNTYNPNNLEYSFTLTPTLIQAIKEYNSGTNYDDFNLTCATEDGRECISEFITNLAKGEVKDGGILLAKHNNYADINSWGEDKLTQIRNVWKYYDGSTNDIIEYDRGYMTLNNYIQRYEKWGVLP